MRSLIGQAGVTPLVMVGCLLGLQPVRSWAIQLEVASWTSPPNIDGVLEENAWRTAPARWVNGVECRVGADQTFLYLAFRCTLSQAPLASPTLAHDDPGLATRPCLEWVFVESVGGEVTFRYHRVFIEPLKGYGEVLQEIGKDEAAVTRAEWHPNLVYQEAFDKKSREWTVEVRVPLSDLHVTKVFPGLHRTWRLRAPEAPVKTVSPEWHRLVWRVEPGAAAPDYQSTFNFPDPKTTPTEDKRKIVAKIYQDAQEFFDAISGGASLDHLRKRFPHVRGLLMPWFGPRGDIWNPEANYENLRRNYSDPGLQADVGLVGVFMTAPSRQEFLDRVTALYGPFAVENFNRNTNWGKMDVPEEGFVKIRDEWMNGWYERITQVNITWKEFKEKYKDATRPTIKAVLNAIEKYREDWGQYPADLKGLVDRQYVTPEELKAEEFVYAYDVVENAFQLDIAPTPKQAWLGISTRFLDAEGRRRWKVDRGAEVADMVSGGPAAKAGMGKGDILLQIEKDPVSGPLDCLRLISGRPIGSTVRISLLRNGTPREVIVQLEARTSR